MMMSRGDIFVSFGQLTDKGSRPGNEDSIGVISEDGAYCFILADGLGGHDCGEVASGLAVQEVMTVFCESGLEKDFLDAAFMCAQNKILEVQSQDNRLKEMKTTLVVLSLVHDEVSWGHVGDSRLYHFCGNRYVERTADHSVPQKLYEAHMIKESEIRHHPDRSRLLRVIGDVWENGGYEVRKTKGIHWRKREAFLLCSDGFWELIDEKSMLAFLKASDTPNEWLELMQQEVIKNGAGTNIDNYSAIAVFVKRC